MGVKFKNNSTGTLKIGINNSETAIEVTTGHGDRFPAVADPHYFYATFEDDSANREIVKVTARTAGQDTMTIVRAQEGTSSQAWVALDVFELRLTAGVVEDISEDVDSHETSINALGTLSTQNKNAVDIDGGAIDGVALGANAVVSAKIDNETADVSIKARDHGTNTTPETVNVVYGTGAPPTVGDVPIGTLFVQYTA